MSIVPLNCNVRNVFCFAFFGPWCTFCSIFGSPCRCCFRRVLIMWESDCTSGGGIQYLIALISSSLDLPSPALSSDCFPATLSKPRLSTASTVFVFMFDFFAITRPAAASVQNSLWFYEWYHSRFYSSSGFIIIHINLLMFSSWYYGIIILIMHYYNRWHWTNATTDKYTQTRSCHAGQQVGDCIIEYKGLWHVSLK